MSLKRWLKQFSRDETPMGDLAREVAADRCFPRPVSADRFERYADHLVWTHDAPDAAIDTLRAAWNIYTAERGPQ